MKLHLFQIDSAVGDHHFSKKIVELPTNEIPENDFPIRVIYDSNFCLLFVYTKFGFVFAVEPHTGVCVMNEKYSDSPLYLITPSADNGNHFVLNRRGDIIQTSIEIDSFFSKCIEKGLEFYESAGLIMDNLSYEKQKATYRHEFDKLKNNGLYQDALYLVAKSGKPFMRTFEYLSSIKDFPNVNDTSALLEYFAIILEDGRLNEVESLELVQLALKKKKLEIVRKWLAEDQIFCTTQLGNTVLSEDVELALHIYQKSNSDSMTIYCLAILGKYDNFKSLLKTTSEEVDLHKIASELIKSKIELLPIFLQSIIEVSVSSIDAQLIQDIIDADLGAFSNDIVEIICSNPELLSHINSESINNQLSKRLLTHNPDLFSVFLRNCEEYNLALSKEEILPLLKSKDDLKVIAFCFETDLSECLMLADSLIGQEVNAKSTNMAKSDIKQFIFTKIEEDPSKYGRLCAKMGQFIGTDDFEVVKDLLKSNVDEESFCDFLMHWSRISTTDDSLASDILGSIIKLGDEEKLLEFSQNVVVSDPKKAFEQISVTLVFKIYCLFSLLVEL